MDERTRLIEHLQQARRGMYAVVDQIHRQMEIYPGWTIKHILAHITGWDDAMIASLRSHMVGDVPATPAVRGIDYYNAQTVEERSSLDYGRIYREWEVSRKELEKIILEMPAEKFAQPLVLPWGNEGTVSQVVGIFTRHEEAHAAEIQDLLNKTPKSYMDNQT